MICKPRLVSFMPHRILQYVSSESGPLAYRPYPRRLQSQTTHYYYSITTTTTTTTTATTTTTTITKNNNNNNNHHHHHHHQNHFNYLSQAYQSEGRSNRTKYQMKLQIELNVKNRVTTQTNHTNFLPFCVLNIFFLSTNMFLIKLTVPFQLHIVHL